jgi:hypothetical protein
LKNSANFNENHEFIGYPLNFVPNRILLWQVILLYKSNKRIKMKNRLRILILVTAIFGISNFNLNAQEVSLETRIEPTKKISIKIIEDALRRNKKILAISTAALTAVLVSAGVYYNKEKIRNLFVSKPKGESEEEKKAREKATQQQIIDQKKQDKAAQLRATLEKATIENKRYNQETIPVQSATEIQVPLSASSQDNTVEAQDESAEKQAETDAKFQELLVETAANRSLKLATGIQERQLRREQEDKVQGDEQPSKSTPKVGNGENETKKKKKKKSGASRKREKKRAAKK